MKRYIYFDSKKNILGWILSTAPDKPTTIHDMDKAFDKLRVTTAIWCYNCVGTGFDEVDLSMCCEWDDWNKLMEAPDGQ